MTRYEKLKQEAQRLQSEGKLHRDWPTRDQRIDWVYGTTHIEDSSVTMETVIAAVDTPAKK